jgi:hypothetical protein
MAKASSISVSKFSSAVEAAVKAAVERHPNLKLNPSTPISVSYFIWGIPVPEEIAGRVTVRESQAFATDVAKQLDSLLPGRGLEGALLSRGGHLIIGIPAPPDVLLER